MNASWLVARPVAHRGLHDRAAGRPENTLAAARAAIAAGFAIECDLQRTADGEAVVFHDFTLDRLTRQAGPVADRPARALAALSIAGTAETIPSLPAFLDVVAGRVPLVCEIKSAFDGDMRLALRAGEILSSYSGPVAVKSFDPAVVAYIRRTGALAIPLGIVAEAQFDDPEWAALATETKRDMAALAHFPDTRPDFLSFRVDDLPHAGPVLFRAGLGRPVMAWTVRTPEQRDRSRLWADQMVFEGPDIAPHAAALA